MLEEAAVAQQSQHMQQLEQVLREVDAAVEASKVVQQQMQDATNSADAEKAAAASHQAAADAAQAQVGLPDQDYTP